MQSWLRRWRWWLLLALFLATTAGLFLRELLTPDPLQVPLARVESGMTEQQVDAAMVDCGSTRRHKDSPPGRHIYAISYHFESGFVWVQFEDDRIANKSIGHWRKPTLWDKFRAMLYRVRGKPTKSPATMAVTGRATNSLTPTDYPAPA